MAAPTDVRVEAESDSTDRLRWTYAGTADIAVYRSTDGSSYSEVTTATTRIVAGTTEYEDTGLSSGTKYWYKLSDDLGSTFSSVVTVITHSCPTTPSRVFGVTMPQANSDPVDAATFNELAQRTEVTLVRLTSPDGRTCVACVSDGALNLDCFNYDGCAEINVNVDQDINSISIPNCANTTFNINFIIPPNVTRKIGGWPRGTGFTGDEGFRAPIAGGSTGRTINEFVDKSLNVNSRSGRGKPGTGTGGTGTGGQSRSTGSGCTCTPGSNGELSIRVCKPDGSANPTNSLNCAAATKGARVIACGGQGPYTWSNTGSVTLSGTSGSAISVNPPTNSGSGVAGNAYRIGRWIRCTSGGGIIGNRMFSQTYSCNDVGGGCTTNSANNNQYDPDGPCPGGTCCEFCGDTGAACGGTETGTTQSNTVSDCTGITCSESGGTMCDMRSATMITNGCNPCGLQAGATITVTDALGVTASVVLRA